MRNVRACEGGLQKNTKYQAAELPKLHLQIMEHKVQRSATDHLHALDHWVRNNTFSMDLATPVRDCLRECSNAFNDMEPTSTMEVGLVSCVHGGETGSIAFKIV